jgi:hypothetical protein
MDTDIQHHPQAFQVKLRHLRVPDEDLLADLQRVAKKLGTARLSMGQYARLGRFDFSRFSRRFGGWTAALARVSLKPTKSRVTKQILIDDIRRVAEKLHVNQLTIDVFAHGCDAGDRRPPIPREIFPLCA